MKRWGGIFIVLLTVVCGRAFADVEGGKFGIGFVIGEPVAISAKYFVSAEKAFDFGLSIHEDQFWQVYGDYHYVFPGLFGRSAKFVEQLNPYMGFGALLVMPQRSDHDQAQYFDKRDQKYAIGARIPVGIEWIWDRAPLGVGIELVPGVIVAPSTEAILQGGLTIRYYF
jgi:hypothetical protein